MYNAVCSCREGVTVSNDPPLPPLSLSDAQTNNTWALQTFHFTPRLKSTPFVKQTNLGRGFGVTLHRGHLTTRFHGPSAKEVGSEGRGSRKDARKREG